MKIVRQPLQPYERDLIRILGCTEEEYVQHVNNVRLRAIARPAVYDGVPDVQAGFLAPAVPFLINLAIGLAVTAVAVLITPKPRGAKPQDAPTTKESVSVKGSSRFSETYGFDSSVALAEYGAPIAIMFGKLTATTGGILATPSLVWSRMFSYGSEDATKVLFVVGEYGLRPPDLQGIFLGNQPLNAIYSQQFAFYWRSEAGDSRIKVRHLVYGTRGTPQSADPSTNDDVYLVPTATVDAATGFCGAYTPSNNQTFGGHSPLRNGTAYRLNWRTVPFLDYEDQEDDPQHRIRDERLKVSGSASDERTYGQRGEGRGYSCRTGLIHWNGVTLGSPAYDVQMTVGGELLYFISGERYSDSGYNYESGITNQDIEATVDDFRVVADDAMQVGEIFVCGRTVLQCEARITPGVWEPGNSMLYRLRVIEILGNITPIDRRIGICGERPLKTDILYEGGVYDKDTWVDTGFYPLLKASFATVRNTRPTETTEIGIASEVWNQAQGLCNFPSIPTPAVLERADKSLVAIGSGSNTSYMRRTSGFSVQVRKTGGTYSWFDLGLIFVVTSSNPTVRRNWLRFRCGTKQQCEFRFVPYSGASLRSNAEREVIQLDTKSGGRVAREVNVPNIGLMRIAAPGRVVLLKSLQQLNELRSQGDRSYLTNTGYRITGLGIASFSPPVPPYGVNPAYYVECLGLASSYPNQRRTVQLNWTAPNGLRRISWELSAFSTPATPEHLARWGTAFQWLDPIFKVINYQEAGRWQNFPTFPHHPAQYPGIVNPYYREGASYASLYANYLVAIEQTQVGGDTPPSDIERVFELDTQIADVSHYSEIRKSNENKPEHTISWVNEIVSNERTPEYTSMTTAGLVLRASRNFNKLDSLRFWLADGIPVTLLTSGGTGPSNLLTDIMYYLYTSLTGTGAVVRPELLDRDDLARTGRFLEANKLFFDGGISEPQNLSSYFSSMAPLFMCDMVKRNGRLSLSPAVPVTSTGTISLGAVPISAVFNAGNVLEGSFAMDYLSKEERKAFRAVVSWRTSARNQLPEVRTAQVRWGDASGTTREQEEYDMSPWCTSREQALMIGRFVLSVRRRVEYSVKFTAFPEGLKLAPGDYIRVNLESAPYSSVRNGVIHPETGAIASVQRLADGSYPVIIYKSNTPDSIDATLTIRNGIAVDRLQWGSIFTVRNTVTTKNVFVVESLEINEDALVEITAIHHPVNDALTSVIAQDVMNPSLFVVAE